MGDTGRICTISQVAGLLHLLQWAIERQVYWLICLSLVSAVCQIGKRYSTANTCGSSVLCHGFCLVDACFAFFFHTTGSLTGCDRVCLTGKSLSGGSDPPERTLKFRVTPYSPVPSAGEGRKYNLEGLVLSLTSFNMLNNFTKLVLFQCCHYRQTLFSIPDLTCQ